MMATLTFLEFGRWLATLSYLLCYLFSCSFGTLPLSSLALETWVSKAGCKSLSNPSPLEQPHKPCVRPSTGGTV